MFTRATPRGKVHNPLMADDRLWTAFSKLTEVMARLRQECPWDRKQTHASLRRYLLEETYELLEALDGGDLGDIKGELGDLMFQVWFHAELAAEGDQGFDLADVLTAITSKLVRRHPHVFGDTKADDATAVKRNWEAIKLAEGRTSVIDGVPRTLPALAAAHAIQDKVAAVGFDWARSEDVLAKVHEELHELAAEAVAERKPDPRRVREELGDVLFAVVNYGRHLGLDGEDALREANLRFTRRFQRVEDLAKEAGTALPQMTLEEMDALWNRAKKEERAGK